MERTTSYRSFIDANGAEIVEMLDSDEDSGVEVLPTPTPVRRSRMDPSWDKEPIFTPLDDGGDTEREDSDQESLPDWNTASQQILSKGASRVRLQLH